MGQRRQPSLRGRWPDLQSDAVSLISCRGAEVREYATRAVLQNRLEIGRPDFRKIFFVCGDRERNSHLVNFVASFASAQKLRELATKGFDARFGFRLKARVDRLPSGVISRIPTLQGRSITIFVSVRVMPNGKRLLLKWPVGGSCFNYLKLKEIMTIILGYNLVYNIVD